ncbi:BTB/POZ protein [Ochromonadaceae sp. CCMP2298]|nr:BTB/POZ protein [Ochromonadaceae sp. CCMP2298]
MSSSSSRGGTRVKTEKTEIRAPTCTGSKRAREVAELELTEVQLEQSAQEVDDGIQRLMSKHQKRESAFQKSYTRLNEKARALIAELAGVPQLEQAAREMDEGMQRLLLKHQKKESAFQRAYTSLNEKAHVLIAEAKRCKLEAEAVLAAAAEEKQQWEAEKIALAGVQQFEPIVNLNVGGVLYITSLSTLCRFPSTMIGCMFSGRHSLPIRDGHFFIDRDGRHFRHILNFLRAPEGYRCEVKGDDEKQLRRECEYYGIDQHMVTEKSLIYYDACSESQGKIAVRVDYEVKFLSYYSKI